MSYEAIVSDGQARKAVADALKKHSDQLRAFVRRRTSEQHVDDVLQAAAVVALEKAGSLQDPEAVLGWLYQIHRSTLVDMGRRVTARKRWEDDKVDATEVSSQLCEETEIDLCGCSVHQAKSLKPAYAEILGLVDLGDASISEASERLGISANNATVRLHRARAALRKKMFEHCGVTEPGACVDCRCTHDGCCAA